MLGWRGMRWLPGDALHVPALAFVNLDELLAGDGRGLDSRGLDRYAVTVHRRDGRPILVHHFEVPPPLGGEAGQSCSATAGATPAAMYPGIATIATAAAVTSARLPSAMRMPKE